MKCLSKCPYSKKDSLSWKIPGWAPDFSFKGYVRYFFFILCQKKALEKTTFEKSSILDVSQLSECASANGRGVSHQYVTW